MAFTANTNLNSDPTTILRDQQHAAKLFNTDQFRLAPKFDFLFHVSFGININSLKNTAIVQRYGTEINMLVKNIDLPSFTVTVDTVNQYNRKKNIQTTHTIGEFSLTFHDDNMGLINQLWQNYYSYYFADSTSAQQTGAYSRNATLKSDYIITPYGLDNNSTAPFFNYIKIYQMARHEYVCYTLINPIITSWAHKKVDYFSNKTHDNDMRLKAEAITYSVDSTLTNPPEGVDISHYDLTPSPLTGINPDPTVRDPSFAQSLDTTGLASSILNNAIQTVNNYQNTPSSAGSTSSAVGIALGLGAVAAGINALGGLSGFKFPGSSNTASDITNATPSSIDDASAAQEEDTDTEAANQQAVEDANTNDQVAAAQAEHNAGENEDSWSNTGSANTDAESNTDSNTDDNGATSDSGESGDENVPGAGETPTDTGPSSSINYDQADF